MNKFWIFNVDQKNWEIIKKHNIIGSKYKIRLEKVNISDIIFVYVIRPLSSIIGKFSVISNCYLDRQIFFYGDFYSYRIDLKPIKLLKTPLNIKNIIHELDFIKNKEKWFTHFFGGRGIRELSKKDFETINNIINKNN